MKESISAATRETVLRRDGYRCIAPQLDGRAGWCRDQWGDPITHWSGRDPGPAYLQMSHTKPEGELAMAKKAAPTQENLVSLCPFHHTGTQAGSNWEAVNRWKIRRHLQNMYGSERTR